MDELNYMKQLVREYFDVVCFDEHHKLTDEEADALCEREFYLETQLKELSGYED